METIAVLGASPKPERYSNMAIQNLKKHGYQVLPIHPRLKEIEGYPVIPSLNEIDQPVHTLTLYVGPERLKEMVDDIVALSPKRVIFNPGTESDILEKKLKDANIPYIHGCTIVMLQTNQF